jgi:Transcription factor WhiB
MVYNIDWAKDANCVGLDTNLFFDLYEEDRATAHDTDQVCMSCIKQRECLALGVSRKEWGVWGGIYLEDGDIGEEYNTHKTSEDWEKLWLRLTTLTV